MPPGEHDLGLLHLGGGGQHDVGVAGRVGDEVLAHHREQVFARQPLEDLFLLRDHMAGLAL